MSCEGALVSLSVPNRREATIGRISSPALAEGIAGDISGVSKFHRKIYKTPATCLLSVIVDVVTAMYLALRTSQGSFQKSDHVPVSTIKLSQNPILAACLSGTASRWSNFTHNTRCCPHRITQLSSSPGGSPDR